jgi:dihydrofolate reductase
MSLLRLKQYKLLPVPIKLIAAIDSKGGISKLNRIPWKLNKDFKFFKSTISQTRNPHLRNVLIMGRKTFHNFKSQLTEHVNIVITNKYYHKLDKTIDKYTVQTAHSLWNALSIVSPTGQAYAAPEDKYNLDSVFICGGSSIYNEAIKDDIVDEYYITHIKKDYDCDNCINLDNLNKKLTTMKSNVIYFDDVMEIKKYY